MKLSIPHSNQNTGRGPAEPARGSNESAQPGILEVWRQIRPHQGLPDVFAVLIASQPELIGRLTSLPAAESFLRQALQGEVGNQDIRQIGRMVLALAHLLEVQDKTTEAEQLYLHTLARPGLARDDAAWLTENLSCLLQRMGRANEAMRMRHEFRVEALMRSGDNSDLATLRSMALSLFMAEQYALAERVYRHLLSRGFETLGNTCHLARVLLVTGREAEANACVREAVAGRANVESYQVARALFILSLCDTLAGRDERAHLNDLMSALAQPGSRMEWTVGPVLEALKTRLTPASHEFYTQLASILSGQSH